MEREIHNDLLKLWEGGGDGGEGGGGGGGGGEGWAKSKLR